MFARICASVLIAALTSGVFMSAAYANQLPLFLSPSAQTDAPLPLTPADATTNGQGQETGGVSTRLQRQIVDYPTREAAGTIIIDTPNTYLYYVLGNGRALRYGIGVGREGFTWSGVETITRKAEWPDWTPPEEMIHRQPYLPRVMAGGPGNPLGARAMYLGGTIYRIHGTNDPQTIGQQVSSGCIRMVNEDVIDLYGRVTIGTKVIVRPAQRIEPTAAARGLQAPIY
jgi:lipoprotein-anchoring transpeptidase ErfK/SrfK